MSIMERLKKVDRDTGIFGVVGGLRLDGKSTLGGTLPGKTLLLQADVIETGSESALALASRLGNQLDVVSFDSLHDCLDILKDKEILEYDNIYIDGLSAINEMRYVAEDVQKASKKNIWDAFRILGDDLRKFLLTAKKITTLGPNVFLTLAYKSTVDANGNISELKPDVKGNVTISEIQRLCPVVVAVTKSFDDDGKLVRKLLTKSDEVYPARVDSLLDDDNPGVLPADLSLVIDLIKGGK